MTLDQLQKIAEAAAMLPWDRERTDVPFEHRWKFMHDIQPEDVLRLIAVARAAKAAAAVYGGPHKETLRQDMDALRAAVAELDKP